MNAIQKNRVIQIKDLHAKFTEAFKKTLDYGIRIGELLKKQKEELPHGEFGQWIEREMPFTKRTAQNYMRLYRDRERIKNETVSHLTEAYKLLEEPKEQKNWVEEWMACNCCCVNQLRECKECDSWELAFCAAERLTGIPSNYLLIWHQNLYGIVDDDLSPFEPTDDDRRQMDKLIQDLCNEIEEKINGKKVSQ